MPKPYRQSADSRPLDDDLCRRFAESVANIGELVQLRHAVQDLVFFPRKTARSQVAGGQRSHFRGRGMDFEEVRLYHPGDDVRAIDWRVTARTRTPHTKVFREERERPVFVIADLRRHMLFGSRELKVATACRVSAALAWAGINANDRVGGLLFAASQQQDIRPRRSHHTVLQLIHALHDLCLNLPWANADNYSLANLIEETRRIAHPGASVFLVSDFHDIDHRCEEHLYELTRHCDITLCQIHDKLERELPPPGYYPVIAGNERHLLNTRSASLQQRCADAFDARTTQLQRLSNELRAGLLRFSTDDSVAAVLNSSYGKRKGRIRR